MNSNDFERELGRQEIRQIPDEWREQILGNAIAEAKAQGQLSRELTFAATGNSWWRELLWPCPQAWAGLAAVWIAILILNSTGDKTARVARSEPTESSPELLIALRQQRRLLADLIEPSALAEFRKSFVPRPRSERRPESVTV